MIHQVIQIPCQRWYFKFNIFVWLFYIFPWIVKPDKATYLSFIFKFIISKKLSNSLWGSDLLLFSEFINIVSTLFYNFIEFMILFYTFLVISSFRYKEYIIFLISFSKFSDLLPAFTCASGIGNLWSNCFVVNILICLHSEILTTQATRGKSKGIPLPFCCLLKSRIFPTISTISFWFSFSGIFFILISFFYWINVSLICFTISSFIVWLLS